MQLRPHQEQAIQSMLDNDKGQVIVPTGGGKTICMIMDAVKQLEDYGTVVVVAPRILLAEQLCKEFMEIIDEKYNDVDVMHVHSCLLYTSPSPRDGLLSRMPSSA